MNIEVRKIIAEEITTSPKTYLGKTIAVHIHVFYVNLIPEFVQYLHNIPTKFDLFLSIPEDVNANENIVQESFAAIENIDNIYIKRTPNKGRDIAPMLCTFGKALQAYDILLHLHTKKSFHTDTLKGWRMFCLEHLLSSKKLIENILTLLSTEAGIICPPDYHYNCNTVWSQDPNLKEAQEIINRSSLNINLAEDTFRMNFPQGSMFWARTDYLKKLFDIGYTYNDFPQEPIPSDGTIAHAIERLFFVWGIETNLYPVKLFTNQLELDFHNFTEDRCDEFMKEYKNARRVILIQQETVEVLQKTILRNQIKTKRYKNIWIAAYLASVFFLILLLIFT